MPLVVTPFFAQTRDSHLYLNAAVAFVLLEGDFSELDVLVTSRDHIRAATENFARVDDLVGIALFEMLQAPSFVSGVASIAA